MVSMLSSVPGYSKLAGKQYYRNHLGPGAVAQNSLYKGKALFLVEPELLFGVGVVEPAFLLCTLAAFEVPLPDKSRIVQKETENLNTGYLWCCDYGRC